MNSIGHQWEFIRPLLVKKDATPEQTEAFRRAFYLGAESVLRVMWGIGQEDVSEQAGMGMLQGMHEECQAYAREVGQGSRLPKWLVDAIVPEQNRGTQQ